MIRYHDRTFDDVITQRHHGGSKISAQRFGGSKGLTEIAGVDIDGVIDSKFKL